MNYLFVNPTPVLRTGLINLTDKVIIMWCQSFNCVKKSADETRRLSKSCIVPRMTVMSLLNVRVGFTEEKKLHTNRNRSFQQSFLSMGEHHDHSCVANF